MKKLFLISLLIGNVAFANVQCAYVSNNIQRCEVKLLTHTEICYRNTNGGIHCFVLQNQSAVN